MDNLLSIWVLDSWWQLAQEGPGGIRSLPGNTLSSNHSLLAGSMQCGVLKLVSDHPKLLGVSPYNHDETQRHLQTTLTSTVLKKGLTSGFICSDLDFYFVSPTLPSSPKNCLHPQTIRLALLIFERGPIPQPYHADESLLVRNGWLNCLLDEDESLMWNSSQRAEAKEDYISFLAIRKSRFSLPQSSAIRHVNEFSTSTRTFWSGHRDCTTRSKGFTIGNKDWPLPEKIWAIPKNFAIFLSVGT